MFCGGTPVEREAISRAAALVREAIATDEPPTFLVASRHCLLRNVVFPVPGGPITLCSITYHHPYVLPQVSRAQRSSLLDRVDPSTGWPTALLARLQLGEVHFSAISIAGSKTLLTSSQSLRPRRQSSTVNTRERRASLHSL